MGNQFVQQVQVVSGQDDVRPATNLMKMAFFDEDGNAVDPSGVTPAAANANIATVDATDLASAIALANATKESFNALQGKLRTAGLLLP